MSDKEIDIVEKEEEVVQEEEIKEGDSTEEEQAELEKLDEVVEETPCCCGGEKNVTFFRSLLATLVDSAICLGIAYVLEFLFDIIIKLPAIGYMVTNKVSILFIIFILTSVLYTSIMESKFKGETIGKGLFNIKVIKK